MPLAFFDQQNNYIPNSSDWTAALKILLLLKSRHNGWDKWIIRIPDNTTLAACHQLLENTPDPSEMMAAGYFLSFALGSMWGSYMARFAERGIGGQVVMEATELENRLWAYEKTQVAAQEGGEDWLQQQRAQRRDEKPEPERESRQDEMDMDH